MANQQQRSNKESKKPKKDSSPPKMPSTSSEPMRPAIVTAVFPKGKEKKKQG